MKGCDTAVTGADLRQMLFDLLQVMCTLTTSTQCTSQMQMFECERGCMLCALPWLSAMELCCLATTPTFERMTLLGGNTCIGL